MAAVNAPFKFNPQAPSTIDAVTKPFENVTKSLQDWLEQLVKDTNLDYYGSSLFIAVLLFILFIHFIAFALANNKGLQGWSKGLSQALFELQVWLQTVVVKLLLYYGAFIAGLFMGAANNSIESDLYSLTPYVKFLVIIYIINKTCLILTGQKNPEYTTGPGGAATGVLSLTKTKWLYTVITWLETVTDIIIQQVVPGSIYGYAVGKVALAIKLA
jgi:hypothetical protein